MNGREEEIVNERTTDLLAFGEMSAIPRFRSKLSFS